MAALYVVLCHVFLNQPENLSQWISLPSKILRYGSFSVALFIVLSGYCLMLPVVRSKTHTLSGNLYGYFHRRVRRIIPPYYVVLILCCLLSLFILAGEQFTNFQWSKLPYDWFSTTFTVKNVILHLLLIHNLTPDFQEYVLNLPLWSVGLEWQIYFLFPLILLPLWRRWNWFVVIAIAFLIGLTPHYLFSGYLDFSRPWFVGAFSLGMLAADIVFSDKPHLMKLRKCWHWEKLAIIFTGLAILTEWQILGIDVWICETFAAMAAACLIIYCSQIVIENKTRPFILRLFEHTWLLTLGSFSYSLYLTHGPIVTLVRHWLISLQLSPVLFTAMHYLLSVGLSLLFAYLFYLRFEKPFISHSSKVVRT
ncbi:acyltransferase 3 [Richelia sinica FACHB-800]|uniref:Acyltransferase 3 n=2 Tax=Richelia TaxID=98443 RepID=A0A975Y4G9_9NOST|nr:acyltransferase 3 [Richelia sinica FACHB-800]